MDAVVDNTPIRPSDNARQNTNCRIKTYHWGRPFYAVVSNYYTLPFRARVCRSRLSRSRYQAPGCSSRQPKSSDRPHSVSCRVSGRPYECLLPDFPPDPRGKSTERGPGLTNRTTDKRKRAGTYRYSSCHPPKIPPKSFHRTTRTVAQP